MWWRMLVVTCAVALVGTRAEATCPDFPDHQFDQADPILVGGDNGALLLYQGFADDQAQLPHESGVIARLVRTPDDVTPPISLLPEQAEVGAAYGAGVYLVAWIGGAGKTIEARRLAADGTPLDVAPFEIARLVPDASGWTDVLVGPVAIGWDGRSFLVAWQTMFGLEVLATQVEPTGTVLAPTPIRITDRTGGYGGPAIASDGARWLVAWSAAPLSGQGATIHAAFYDGTTVTELSPVTTWRDGYYDAFPVATFDGQQFVVAWRGRELRATRIATTGAVLDPEGVRLDTSIAGGAPVAVADGAGTTVAWDQDYVDADGVVHVDDTDVLALHIGAGAPIAASPVRVLAGDAEDADPTLGLAAGGVVVAWDRGSPGGDGIYVAELDATLDAGTAHRAARSHTYVEDCGCSAAGGTPGRAGWLLIGAALIAAARRRRSRSTPITT